MPNSGNIRLLFTMLRPRLGTTPWVGFLRNWRMLWNAQADRRRIYLSIFHIVIVMDNIASLLFGNGFCDWDWESDLALPLAFACFIFHSRQASRAINKHDDTLCESVVVAMGLVEASLVGHKVSTAAAAAATVLRTCNVQRAAFLAFLHSELAKQNVSLEFIWCCWVMQRLRQHLNYGDDNAFAYVCSVTWVPCRAAVAMP